MRLLSADGRRLLQELEGRSRYAYDDVTGHPTIGVGHLLSPSERSSGKILIGSTHVRYAHGLTEDQVDELLTQDLAEFELSVDTTLIDVRLDEREFDALVIFAFNIGCEAFEHSTLVKRLREGNRDAVPDQMRRWVYSNGRKLAGLEKRRDAEAELWMG